MNIAFLGTGILGTPMAEKLLECGHRLWAYNRTSSKAEGLRALGATICLQPEEAIKNAEAVILVLADARAIESVLFKDAKEGARHAAPLQGKTVIQMGTISPAQSLGLLKRVKAAGGQYLECPVLGSKNEAKAAQLILMAGATEEQFDKFQALFKCFGPKPRLIGEVGKAAALKLALNQLIASHAACFSLSLGIIVNSGIDVDQFMGILNESSLGAPMYGKKLANWLKHEYAHPNFPLKHLLKDVDLILDEADQLKLNTAVLAAIRKVLKSAEKEGLAQSDYSAVYEMISKKG